MKRFKQIYRQTHHEPCPVLHVKTALKAGQAIVETSTIEIKECPEPLDVAVDDSGEIWVNARGLADCGVL